MAKYNIGDKVIKADSTSHGTIIEVMPGRRGRQLYKVSWDGRISDELEVNLQPDCDVSDPYERCMSGIFGSYSEYSKINTTFKIRSSNNSTISSLKASKTLFRAYQFKPLLKFLNSPNRRLLVVDESLIRAYNEVIKYSARDGIDSYELKNYAADFSSQVRQNLMSEIIEEEWVIKSVGRNLLDRINMLPEVDHPVQVKELYETFLRFDDKPMITGPSAIAETVNHYCTKGVFNVAFGAPGRWSRITQNDSVPFLDVTSEDYWLVDSSVIPETPGNTGSGSGTGSTGGTNTGAGSNTGTGTGNGNGGETTPTAKTFKKVTICGQVPLENYAQLFASFVQTLKNNNLKIEVKFTAKNTSGNPLTENSSTVKSIKESASQLGLDFEVEE